MSRRVDAAVDSVPADLLEVLRSVPDPRARRGVRYPLWSRLAIAILAAAGMPSVAGISTWARTAPEEVLAQLGIRFRRPSDAVQCSKQDIVTCPTFRAQMARWQLPQNDSI